MCPARILRDGNDLGLVISIEVIGQIGAHGRHGKLKFGAELVAPVEVRSMTCEGRMHRLELDDGQVVRGRTVLIATGASYQRLPVAGCERWDGAGIYYSCTAVHARSCKDGRAAVVGGGNSAGQAVMFLAENTAGASLLLRGGDLRKSMSDYLAKRIERHPAPAPRGRSRGRSRSASPAW